MEKVGGGKEWWPLMAAPFQCRCSAALERIYSYLGAAPGPQATAKREFQRILWRVWHSSCNTMMLQTYLASRLRLKKD